MASFDNAYRDIGRQLEIPGVEDDKADVKRLVKTRLSLGKHREMADDRGQCG